MSRLFICTPLQIEQLMMVCIFSPRRSGILLTYLIGSCIKVVAPKILKSVSRYDISDLVVRKG